MKVGGEAKVELPEVELRRVLRISRAVVLALAKAPSISVNYEGSKIWEGGGKTRRKESIESMISQLTGMEKNEADRRTEEPAPPLFPSLPDTDSSHSRLTISGVCSEESQVAIASIKCCTWVKI